MRVVMKPGYSNTSTGVLPMRVQTTSQERMLHRSLHPSDNLNQRHTGTGSGSACDDLIGNLAFSASFVKLREAVLEM